MTAEMLQQLNMEFETCRDFFKEHQDDAEKLQFLRDYLGTEWYYKVEDHIENCWPKERKPALYALQDACNDLIMTCQTTLQRQGFCD